MEGNIGYIKMTSFTRNVSNEVAEAFKEISEGVELNGLIFDLRGNPGGLLMRQLIQPTYLLRKGKKWLVLKEKLRTGIRFTIP